ncbi:MAG: 5-methyltetrahydropteroyltriglutamate--homocysteine S-methyltransferase [Gammaproteobacteria bacterium]|nr:5-methyltetrahydropteroyltriglutamate--homocysteine S-methyltransferase [Gammaproteobacteria bacterium]
MHQDTIPFRADHVGSLLRPPELLDARARREKNEISAAALRKIEDQAILHAVKLQEDAGLNAITDGEYRRFLFHVDFLEKIHGVQATQSNYKVKFRGAKEEVDFAPPVLAVTGRMSLPEGGIALEDFKYLAAVTRRTPKVCIPSPSMLHFRGGRKSVDMAAYPQIEEFFSGLARIYREEIAGLSEAGCRYLQLDDTNFAYLCDPVHRDRVRSIGEDPERLPSIYAKLISDCVRDRPKDMIIGIHLCRGNFRSAWVAEGGYETVARTLFNEIDADRFLLEYDDMRSGNFEPLRLVPRGKVVVLGLVTSKRPELESKDELKRRIEEASKYVPLEHLALSPQCGFSSSVHGNDLTEDQERAKLRLVVETAREVWG